MAYGFNDNKSKFSLDTVDDIYELACRTQGHQDVTDKTKIYIIPKQKMLYAYIQTTIPASFYFNNVTLFSNLPQVLGISGFAYRQVRSPLFSVKTDGSANDIVADAYVVIARGNASPYTTTLDIYFKTQSYERSIFGMIAVPYTEYDPSYPLSSSTLIQR